MLADMKRDTYHQGCVTTAYSNVRSQIISCWRLLTVYLCLTCCGSIGAPEKTCELGFQLVQLSSDIDLCVPCMDGYTFMDLDKHTERKCYPCTQIQDFNVEIIFYKCNKTHDTVIHCKPGYYRGISENDANIKCMPCTQCDNAARQCEKYHDTVCCPSPHYEAVLNQDNVLICKLKNVTCKEGQYYSDISAHCDPCPENTYMPVTKHTLTKCFPCQTLSDIATTHATVIRECSKYSPTLFGCQDNYFKDILEDPTIEGTCSACQKCLYVGKPCERFHDAVCCPGPTMMFSQENGSFQGCLPVTPPVECGEGEYLYKNGPDSSHTCLKCPRGSFMDELSHTRTRCKNYLQDIQLILAQQQENRIILIILVFFNLVSIFLFAGGVIISLLHRCFSFFRNLLLCAMFNCFK